MRVFKAVSTLSSWACMMVFMASNDVEKDRSRWNYRTENWLTFGVGLKWFIWVWNPFLFLGACLSLRSA